MCFARGGYGDVVAADIARTAGVSVGSFYQYFSDKGQAFLGVASRFFRDLEKTQAEQVFAASKPPRPEDYRKMLTALAEVCRSYGRVFGDIYGLSFTDARLGSVLAKEEASFEQRIAEALIEEVLKLEPDRAGRSAAFAFVLVEGILFRIVAADLPAGHALLDEAAEALAAWHRAIAGRSSR